MSETINLLDTDSEVSAVSDGPDADDGSILAVDNRSFLLFADVNDLLKCVRKTEKFTRESIVEVCNNIAKKDSASVYSSIHRCQGAKAEFPKTFLKWFSAVNQPFNNICLETFLLYTEQEGNVIYHAEMDSLMRRIIRKCIAMFCLLSFRHVLMCCSGTGAKKLDAEDLVKLFHEIVAVLKEFNPDALHSLMFEKKNEIVGWWKGTFAEDEASSKWGQGKIWPKEKIHGYALWLMIALIKFDREQAIFYSFIRELMKQHNQDVVFFREMLIVMLLTFGSVLNTVVSFIPQHCEPVSHS